MNYSNPFEYEAADKFTFEEIADFYISDFNYSRFIKSKRNVFLVGERGTGKTMAFLYNSFKVQNAIAHRTDEEPNLDIICIYIPCNTPLILRREYELLSSLRSATLSEHIFVLSVMYGIVDNLSVKASLLQGVDVDAIRRILSMILELDIKSDGNLFDDIKHALHVEFLKAQQELNKMSKEESNFRVYSYFTGVVPLLNTLRSIPLLNKSHFALLMDDAHYLSASQIRALNSWISYRDNSLFSFKVASVKVDAPSAKTSSGGIILEGHDYTSIDMERPFQNEDSEFGHFARDIVKRRLMKIGLDSTSADTFFPENPLLTDEIKTANNFVREAYISENPSAAPKQISDHVYKYGRAQYFRSRDAKANRVPYSGFDTLVHLSTGVIRNLLEPCYWMYDAVLSKQSSTEPKFDITSIPPPIQTQIIMERSKKKWELIRNGLDRFIEECSSEQALQIYHLFDNLAILFRERLLTNKSEPRAIAFAVTERKYLHWNDLMTLLTIAQRSQILYTYVGSAKELGKRQLYYVPNRILWPERGLDPVGQHSRVYIKSSNLWAAATDNKRIPVADESVVNPDDQERLFDE